MPQPRSSMAKINKYFLKKKQTAVERLYHRLTIQWFDIPRKQTQETKNTSNKISEVNNTKNREDVKSKS